MNIMQNRNKPPVNMRRTLRLLDGGMPMNTTPMSGQDSAAFGNMQNTMVSMRSTPAAPAPVATPAVATPIAKPARSPGKVAAADYSLPGNTFSPMAVPQLRDGGEVSPWSMRGIIKNVSKAFEKTPEQKQQEYAQRLAEAKARMAAREAAAAPAPAQPARETAAPMGSQSVLDRRMAAAGLRDGGEISLWGRVKSALTPTPQTPEQAQHARDLAEYKARAAAARSAPAPAPAAQPAPAAHALTQYGNGDATAARMKAAGLQDGGTVPGKGKGDKIPALYEPGEFVVSNAMLDAAPQLREQLHDLRGNVLARQGKSVEQADAEAVSYGGTTGEDHAGVLTGVLTGAQGRGRHQRRDRGRPDANMADAGGHSRDGGNRGLRDSGVTLRASTGGAPPVLQLGLDPAVANRAAEATRQAAFEADTLAKAKAAAEAKVQSARVMPANAGPARPPRGYRTGQAAAGLLKKAPVVGQVLSAAAEAGDVAEVAMDKGSSKLDVATQTAEGVSKLAGATAGGLAGAAVGGPLAPLTGLAGGIAGYYAPEVATKGLRWVTGQDTSSPHERMLARTAEGASPGPTPKYTPTPDSVAPWGNESRRQLANINAPSGNVRGTEDFSKTLSTVPKDLPTGLRDGMVYKTKGANGETVYSGRNISGNVNGRMLNGDGTSAGPMRGSVETSAGAPVFGGGGYAVDNNAPTGAVKQAQINATLRNPDGSTWTARDNAVMAANLRDGADPYRGTSRQPQNDEHAQVRALANSPVGTIGRHGAMKRLSEIEQNQTTLRGQDLEAQTRQGQNEAARRTQLNDDRKYELDVARLGLESANKLRDDKRAGEEAFSKRITSMIGDDKDGVVAARVRNGANVFLADSIRAAEAELRQNPGNAKATRDLRRLQDGGVGALDDKMISDLVLGQQGNAAAAEYAGMAPWSGEAVDTAAPIKSLKLKKGLLFDDYVSDSASGNQVIPARALEKRPDLKRLRIE